MSHKKPWVDTIGRKLIGNFLVIMAFNTKTSSYFVEIYDSGHERAEVIYPDRPSAKLAYTMLRNKTTVHSFVLRHA